MKRWTDNQWYNNGEHIGCVQSSGSYIADPTEGDIGFCAFLQNTDGTWGSIIKQLAPYIPQHGCRVWIRTVLLPAGR